MREFCIQIQPGLLKSFDEASVDALCLASTFEAPIKDVAKTEGEDHGRYINIYFKTQDPKTVWVALRERLMQRGLLGATIVTCTGEDGWSDYMLLHHFDKQYRTGEYRSL